MSFDDQADSAIAHSNRQVANRVRTSITPPPWIDMTRPGHAGPARVDRRTVMNAVLWHRSGHAVSRSTTDTWPVHRETTEGPLVCMTSGPSVLSRYVIHISLPTPPNVYIGIPSRSSSLPGTGR